MILMIPLVIDASCVVTRTRLHLRKAVEHRIYKCVAARKAAGVPWSCWMRSSFPTHTMQQISHNDQIRPRSYVVAQPTGFASSSNA